MTRFRPSSRGRHSARRPARAEVRTYPEASPRPPAPDPPQRGLVRLVFRDGSAMALDAHDPRAVPFRTLADSMWTPPPAADPESGRE
jgi:hypothetical protein